MLFPIVIQDNFFEDPDFVVNYANKLKYEENIEKAPGLRTKPIHQFDQKFFSWITNKSLKLYYPDKDLEFSASAVFQKIPVNLKYDGWVHVDSPCELTALVYLNKHTKTGTSFYRRKTPMEFSEENQKPKHEYFLDSNNNKQIEEAKKLNNSSFEETINIKGIYNRCVMFDASLFHAAHVFTGESKEKERLIFINAIFSISDKGRILKYPTVECKRY